MKEYIERESLKNALYEQRDKYDPYRSDAEKFVMRGFNEADDVIDSIHAADVEKVRHGHWVVIEDLFGEIGHCSECGFFMGVNEPGNGLPNIESLKYCPNCGAKMDGGED